MAPDILMRGSFDELFLTKMNDRQNQFYLKLSQSFVFVTEIHAINCHHPGLLRLKLAPNSLNVQLCFERKILLNYTIRVD